MYQSIKDESGITMPLAMIMVVVISIMGAGLLVFATTDLQSVATVNKGQRALDIAEAGAEGARIRLLSEAYPSAYDADNAARPAYISRACNNDGGWNPLPIPRDNAVSGGGFWNPDFGVIRSFNGGSMRIEMRYQSPIYENETERVRCAGPNSANGTYQELNKGNMAVGSTVGATWPTPRIDAGFYRVFSTACYPGGINNSGDCTDSNAAKRKIEVMYKTESLDAPLAIYTQNTSNDSITIRNTACIRDVNVFTMGGVRLDGTGACTGTGTPTGSATPKHLADTGAVSGSRTSLGIETTTTSGASGTGNRNYGGPFDYGNWKRSGYDNLAHFRGDAGKTYNSNAPYFNVDGVKPDGTLYNINARSVISPGIGAGERIRLCTNSSTAIGSCSTGTSARVANRDFDGSNGFVTGTPTGSQFTFPFDEASVTGQNDANRIDLMRGEAIRQEEYRYPDEPTNKNYITPANNTTVRFNSTGTGSNNYTWPRYPKAFVASPATLKQTSNYNTVVYVRFPSYSSSNNVVWDANEDGNACSGPPNRGILVVENGNVTINGGRTPFSGMVIMRSQGSTKGAFTQNASACTGGGVDTDGKVVLAGTASNIAQNDSSNLDHNSGFFPREVDLPGTVGFHSVELYSWRECYNEACSSP